MENNVSYLEESLNIKFPTSYIQFLSSNNLENKKFSFTMNDGGHISKEVIHFLNFNERSDDYIGSVCKKEEHLEPNQLTPFARTDWEFDLLCFYFDNRGTNHEPKIIYFCFDLYYESLEDAIFYMANSFSEFLLKLNVE
ncbi:SMI1/KNR4 family protein [Cytobacillus firmus]|uniref:SMI1/KNR4 family protein n=1 Tax=Cytobacillus firmus TaxID=1399 RepID=UPI0018CF56FA|nr:SMI1/KNR4 family protein [Cytobacillus firmus]MBG9590176.1 hypothetical protein [Cytobacillus firmus]